MHDVLTIYDSKFIDLFMNELIYLKYIFVIRWLEC